MSTRRNRKRRCTDSPARPGPPKICNACESCLQPDCQLCITCLKRQFLDEDDCCVRKMCTKIPVAERLRKAPTFPKGWTFHIGTKKNSKFGGLFIVSPQGDWYRSVRLARKKHEAELRKVDAILFYQAIGFVEKAEKYREREEQDKDDDDYITNNHKSKSGKKRQSLGSKSAKKKSQKTKNVYSHQKVVGARVYSKFKNGEWYWGTLKKVIERDGVKKFRIRYEDGDKYTVPEWDLCTELQYRLIFEEEPPPPLPPLSPLSSGVESSSSSDEDFKEQSFPGPANSQEEKGNDKVATKGKNDDKKLRDAKKLSEQHPVDKKGNCDKVNKQYSGDKRSIDYAQPEGLEKAAMKLLGHKEIRGNKYVQKLSEPFFVHKKVNDDQQLADSKNQRNLFREYQKDKHDRHLEEQSGQNLADNKSSASKTSESPDKQSKQNSADKNNNDNIQSEQQCDQHPKDKEDNDNKRVQQSAQNPVHKKGNDEKHNNHSISKPVFITSKDKRLPSSQSLLSSGAEEVEFQHEVFKKQYHEEERTLRDKTPSKIRMNGKKVKSVNSSSSKRDKNTFTRKGVEISRETSNRHNRSANNNSKASYCCESCSRANCGLCINCLKQQFLGETDCCVQKMCRKLAMSDRLRICPTFPKGWTFQFGKKISGRWMEGIYIRSPDGGWYRNVKEARKDYPLALKKVDAVLFYQSVGCIKEVEMYRKVEGSSNNNNRKIPYSCEKKVGARVYSKFSNGEWYWGTLKEIVNSREDSKKYHILYEDGDEDTVPEFDVATELQYRLIFNEEPPPPPTTENDTASNLLSNKIADYAACTDEQVHNNSTLSLAGTSNRSPVQNKCLESSHVPAIAKDKSTACLADSNETPDHSQKEGKESNFIVSKNHKVATPSSISVGDSPTSSRVDSSRSRITTPAKNCFEVSSLRPLSRTWGYEPVQSKFGVIELKCKGTGKALVQFSNVLDASLALNLSKDQIQNQIEKQDIKSDMYKYTLKYVKASSAYRYGSQREDFKEYSTFNETHKQRLSRWKTTLLVNKSNTSTNDQNSDIITNSFNIVQTNQLPIQPKLPPQQQYYQNDRNLYHPNHKHQYPRPQNTLVHRLQHPLPPTTPHPNHANPSGDNSHDLRPPQSQTLHSPQSAASAINYHNLTTYCNKLPESQQPRPHSTGKQHVSFRSREGQGQDRAEDKSKESSEELKTSCVPKTKGETEQNEKMESSLSKCSTTNEIVNLDDLIEQFEQHADGENKEANNVINSHSLMPKPKIPVVNERPQSSILSKTDKETKILQTESVSSTLSTSPEQKRNSTGAEKLASTSDVRKIRHILLSDPFGGKSKEGLKGSSISSHLKSTNSHCHAEKSSSTISASCTTTQGKELSLELYSPSAPKITMSDQAEELVPTLVKENKNASDASSTIEKKRNLSQTESITPILSSTIAKKKQRTAEIERSDSAFALNANKTQHDSVSDLGSGRNNKPTNGLFPPPHSQSTIHAITNTINFEQAAMQSSCTDKQRNNIAFGIEKLPTSETKSKKKKYFLLQKVRGQHNKTSYETDRLSLANAENIPAFNMRSKSSSLTFPSSTVQKENTTQTKELSSKTFLPILDSEIASKSTSSEVKNGDYIKSRKRDNASIISNSKPMEAFTSYQNTIYKAYNISRKRKKIAKRTCLATRLQKAKIS